MQLLRPKLLLAAVILAVVGVQATADFAGSSASSSYVVTLRAHGPSGAVAATVRRLERKTGARARFRYNARSLVGFAAALAPRHVTLLKRDRAVAGVYRDPARWIVVYRDGVEVEARTNELERRYGFHSRYRYKAALRGFAARLSSRQLAGLARERDIRRIEPDRPVRGD